MVLINGIQHEGNLNGKPVFTQENVGPLHGQFKICRKKTFTSIMRVNGPFVCLTREGLIDCEDGYLAIDADGFPYPIAKGIFDKTYEEVK